MPPFDPIASPIFVGPGMIDADRVSDGLMSFSDLLPTAMTLAGAPERVPTDRRYVDGIDQTSNLYLDPKESKSYLTRKLAYLDAGRTPPTA